MSATTPQQVLSTVFGYPEFRGLQSPVIHALCTGTDVVALLPTGAGKSLCFQVPGLVLGGTTIVTSPLISLMHDQVAALIKKNISAIALTSQFSREEHEKALESIAAGAYQFVYVSPERAVQKNFQVAVQSADVRLIAIDEAHCICEWGDDFRPSYELLSSFIGSFAKRPTVAALTATATEQTVSELVKNLELQQPKIVVSPVLRSNILWHTIPYTRTSEKMLTLCALVQRFSHTPLIIYAATRVSVEHLAGVLSQLFPHQRVLKYHGGMPADERTEVLAAFLQHNSCCLVATNAFGMGIDKANVRCVAHAEMPGSIEQWYQEVGRAGRDGALSFSFSLFSQQDFLMQKDRIVERKSSYALKMQKLNQLWQLMHTQQCKTNLLYRYFDCKYTSIKCNNCGVCCNSCHTPSALQTWAVQSPHSLQLHVQHPQQPWQTIRPTQSKLLQLLQPPHTHKLPFFGPVTQKIFSSKPAPQDGIL